MHHEELGQEGLGEVALRLQGFMSLGKEAGGTQQEAGEVEVGVGVMAGAREKTACLKKHPNKQTQNAYQACQGRLESLVWA